ncbi:MAG: lysozyme [Erysipelotrichia bacterium]|nr:lysozyme [Erysipelotrichia bacterium]
MVRKRKKKIRVGRIILLAGIAAAIIIAVSAVFSSCISRSASSLEPTPTPDPRYLNSYDWSNLNADSDIYIYEDDSYTSRYGIDVSFHQGVIDWQKVKASGVEFAIIRVGYRGYESGILNEDTKFRANMEGAAAAGIDLGVYFFSSAITREEAEEEAAYVLNEIKDYSITCPVVYDMENVGSNDRIAVLDLASRTEMAAAFCAKIKAAVYEPMVYGSANWLSTMLQTWNLQDSYPFWVASYHQTVKDPEYPYVFEMWQYDNTGTIDGIDKSVDLNIWLKKK